MLEEEGYECFDLMRQQPLQSREGLLRAILLPEGKRAIDDDDADDDFDNATTITTLPFTDTENTTEATTAPDDPIADCFGNGIR